MTSYHKEHTWARQEEDGVYIGVTEHAQSELGEIVYVDLPEEGDELEQGESFGQIESTKTTSDLIAPLSGVVIESNSALEDAPTLINGSPESRGWITKIRPADEAEIDDLMTQEEYLSSLED